MQRRLKWQHGDRILYPPRPSSKIEPATLDSYETGRRAGKWLCQRKFNGTRIVVYISANREVCYLLTRHGESPKQFVLTDGIAAQLCALNLIAGHDYWLDGELLHSKTTTPFYKQRIVLFDVLHAGKYLFGVSQLERLAMLNDICRSPSTLEKQGGIALAISENIWLAQTWLDDFPAHFKDKIALPEIEGLVLRLAQSKLTNFGNKQYNVDWIVRCRKPHKNYHF